jgi:hypothetical protein
MTTTEPQINQHLKFLYECKIQKDKAICTYPVARSYNFSNSDKYIQTFLTYLKT